MYKKIIILVYALSIIGIHSSKAEINGEIDDKDWIISSLKYYESKITNYKCKFTDTFTFSDPRWIEYRINVMGADITKSIDHSNYDYTWELGKVRSDNYVINKSEEKTVEGLSTYSKDKMMSLSPQKDINQETKYIGSIRPKPEIDYNSEQIPNSFMLIDKNGNHYSSIVEDPNTKVYNGIYQGEEVIICEYYGNTTQKQRDFLRKNNFTFVRREIYFANYGDDLFRVSENIEYKELEDDLWFPVAGDRVNYFDDKDGSYKSSVLSMKVEQESLSVNNILPDDVFEIKFPPGTYVNDEITGMRYQVGSHDLIEDIVDDIMDNGFLGVENEDNIKPADKNINQQVDILYQKQITNDVNKYIEEYDNKTNEIIGQIHPVIWGIIIFFILALIVIVYQYKSKNIKM